MSHKIIYLLAFFIGIFTTVTLQANSVSSNQQMIQCLNLYSEEQAKVLANSVEFKREVSRCIVNLSNDKKMGEYPDDKEEQQKLCVQDCVFAFGAFTYKYYLCVQRCLLI